VQIASWGHPQTTGLPTMDYFLSAEEMEPADAPAHYSEKLVLLPHLGCSFPPPRLTPAAHDLRGLGITTSALLVCPGTPFKYAPRHDRVFPEIARRLGECRFVFFTYHVPQLSNRLQLRLRAAFAAYGLDADKFVSFVPWQSPEMFRGLLTEAHLFLDTIGFSGFNTAMQAVECGLPIVTVEGRFMRGRFASGILGRIGLRELVADSDERYVELAVRICQDSGYRRHLQERIAAQRRILFDDPAPVRALEEFLARVATPR
jgi:predicted O-linked N-acetylglucosamine transferase (SPINDLY family)